MPTPKASLKGFFSARRKPTQAQFHQWLDSYIHKNEDGLFLDENGNLGLGSAPNGEARFKITIDSGVSNPHILLEENGADFSRLTFKNNQSPKFWTWAGLASAEDDARSSMNLYYSNGTQGADFLSIKGNGNIGIGTTNPQAKLDINGTIRISAPGNNTLLFYRTSESGNPSGSDDGFRIRQEETYFNPTGGGGDAIIFEKTDSNGTPPDGGVAFVNTGNDGTVKPALIIRGNGNVGIGTTSPNAPLQFFKETKSRKIVLWEAANNDHQFYGFGVNDFTLRYQVEGTGSSHVFYAAGGADSSKELLRIHGNGNVGIGTNSPQGKLHVKGPLRIEEASSTRYWEIVPVAFNLESEREDIFRLEFKFNGRTIFAFQSNGDAIKSGTSNEWRPGVFI